MPAATQNLSVMVRNRESILFQGEAHSLSSNNPQGLFDVLPEHENFISIIKEKLTINTTDHGTKEIPLEMGILRVNDNHISVYLGVTDVAKTSPTE
jgi:F0F1-type ATP synthase epsilon subunit